MANVRLISLLLSVLFLAFPTVARAEAEVPEKAQKYYRVLRNRPHQETLFDRFESAWLDEAGMAQLEAHLKRQAADGNGADWSLLARFYLRRGQDDQALDALAKAIAAQPDDAVLLLERARVQARRLDLEAATLALKKARTSEDPEIARKAAKRLGALFLRMGSIEEAKKVWNEALAKNPGDTDLLEDLVEVAAANGNPEQALAFLEKLQKATTDPYRKTQQKLRQGDLLQKAGRIDDALAVFDQTLDAVGQGSWLEREILARIDALFRRDQRVADLRRHLAELAEKNPGRLAIQRRLAKLEADAGQVDAAIERFRGILTRSPGEVELREEFIALLATHERLAEAVTELESLIEQAGDSPSFQLKMANFQHRLGKDEATLAALEKAHELLGEGEANALRVARLMTEYDLKAEGEALLVARSQRDDASPAVAEALVELYLRTERSEEALALLRKLAQSEDMETVLRAHSRVRTLGKQELAYEMLKARRDEFSDQVRFVGALMRAALAAGRAGEVADDVVRLVKLGQGVRELGEAVALGGRILESAGRLQEKAEALRSEDELDPRVTCLLAGIEEALGNFAAVNDLLEGQSDPLLVRFHAALLERRGELTRAVEAMRALEATAEGRKGSYLRELTEMMRRAGMFEEALATTERWKQAAPGDRNAWIFRSDLLAATGKLEDATRELRRAAARFEDDFELQSRLAGVYRESGNFREATALFWQLYDEAPDQTAQLRWSTELAKTALASGRTAELEEQLATRSRLNSKAVGPLLARAALAGELGDLEKQRDLILQAVRLQPRDLNLRLQAARLAEEAGELDRAVALLEEALPFDQQGRVRQVLVGTYLREGEVEKALGLMRHSADDQKQSADDLIRIATSLAEKNYYEEAIAMLREKRATVQDIKLDLTLANMMIRDGREAGAVDLLVEVLRRPEQASAANSAAAGAFSQMNPFMQEVPPDLREFFVGMQVMMEMQFQRSSPQGAFGALSKFNPKECRLVALALLGQVSSFLEEDRQKEIEEFVLSLEEKQMGLFWNIASAEGEPEGFEEVLLDFMRDNTDDPVAICLRLFALKQADEGAPEIEPFEPSKLREILANEALEKTTRQLALESLLSREDVEPSDLDLLLALYQKTADRDMRSDLFAIMVSLLQADELAGEAFDRLRAAVEAACRQDPPDLPGNLLFNARLATQGEEKLAGLINQAVREFRKEKPQASSAPATPAFQASGFYPPRPAAWNAFAIPYQSIPEWLVRRISNFSGEGAIPFPQPEGIAADAPLSEETLTSQIAQIESPVVRRLIRMKFSDGIKSPDREEPGLTAAERRELILLALVQEDPSEAEPAARIYQLAAEARRLWAGEPDWVRRLEQLMMIHATALSPEEVKKADSELRTLLWRVGQGTARNQGSENEAPDPVALARKLGFEELAERLAALDKPTGGAAAGAARVIAGASIGGAIQSSSGGDPAIQKIKKFIAAGNLEAAAREVRNRYQQLAKSGNLSWEGRELFELLEPDLIEEVVKLMDPGDSKSRVRRLAFADICQRMGREKEARETLQALYEERPEDGEVVTRLIFLDGLDQKEATALLTQTIQDGGEAIALHLRESDFEIDQPEAEATFRIIEMMVKALESCDPEAIANSNLSWVNYYGKEFFEDSWKSKLPSLIENRNTSSRQSDKENLNRREELARALGRQMLRFRQTGEAGFRLLSAWPESGFDDEERWKAAREILLQEQDSNDAFFGGNSNPFALTAGNGSSSSGGSLEKWASLPVILERLASVDRLENLFEPAYLEKFRKEREDLARLLDQLVRVRDIEGTKAYLKTQRESGLGTDLLAPLNEVLLKKLEGVPGLLDLLIEQANWAQESGNSGPFDQGKWTNAELLLKVALAEEKSGSVEKGLEAVVALGFEDAPPWKKKAQGQRSYEYYQFTNVMSELSLTPVQEQKLRGTAFRLGIPLGQSEYELHQHFQSDLKTTEAIITFFEESGMVADLKNWAPPAGLTFEPGNGTLKKFFVFEEALKQMGFENGFPKEVREELASRSEGVFGARMILAAVSEGEAREKFAAEAFASETPETILAANRDFVLFAAKWLSQEGFDQLPAELADKLKGSYQDPTKKARGEVEALIEMLEERPQDIRNFPPYREIVDSLVAVTRVNPGEGIALLGKYAEAVTQASAKNTNLGLLRQTADSATPLDEFFFEVLQQLSSDKQGDPQLALRFLHLVSNDPVVGRLSLAQDDSRALSKWAAQSMMKDISSMPHGGPEWMEVPVALIKRLAEIDEDLRPMALTGMLCRYLSEVSFEKRSLLDWLELRFQEEGLPGPEADVFLSALRAEFWKVCSAEENRETQQWLAQILRREDLPEFARFELFFAMLTSFDRVIDSPEVVDALADLYENYAAADRTVVNPLSARLIDRLSAVNGPEKTTMALGRISKAFWKNANAPRPGGHPTIPSDFAVDLFKVGIRGGDPQARRLLAKIRPQLEGQFPVIMALIAAGETELARRLLPDPILGYDKWYTMAVVTEPFQEKWDAFLASLEDPRQILWLRAALTHFHHQNGTWPFTVSVQGRPTELRDLLTEAVQLEPGNRTLWLTLMRAGLTRIAEVPEAFAQATAWVAEQDYRKLLMEQISSDGEANGDALCLYEHVIILQALAGDPENLGKAVTLRKEMNALLLNRYYYKNLHEMFVKRLGSRVGEAVALGNTEHLAKVAELAFTLAEDVAGISRFDPWPEKEAPLSVAWIAWSATGQSELFDEKIAASKRQEELAKLRGTIKEAGLPEQIAKLAAIFPHWQQAGARNLRENLLKVLLSDPRFASENDHGRGHRLRFGKRLADAGHLGAEMARFVAAAPADLDPDLLLSLQLAAAAHHRKADEPEQALRLLAESRQELDPRELPTLRQSVLFDQIELLMQEDKKDQILPLLEEVDPEFTSDSQQPRLDLLKAALRDDQK